MSVRVAEIAARLRADADALARSLLPRGVYENGGREWKVKGRNSPIGEAISVCVRGPKQGVVGFWNGHKHGGDILDLIQAVQGCDKGGAVEFGKRWLGIGDDERRRLNRYPYMPPPEAIWPDEARREKLDAERDRARRLSRAANVWGSATPLAGPAKAYLTARGIRPDVADAELRAHSGLPHPDGGNFPALVARVKNPAGEICGVWRIFLKPDGSGKAPVENAKLGLGNVAGGAVRIGGVWPEIGVAEGIETALACRQMVVEAGVRLPVWAALSTSGMRGLVLPDEIKLVRIFADADPVKFRAGKIKESPGLAAAEALSARLREAGVAVTIEAPPTGLDWLDVLEANGGSRQCKSEGC